MLHNSGIQYAEDVVSGKIVVGKRVKQACQRFLRMLKAKGAPWVFIPERAEHVHKFVSFIKITKGPDAGKSLSLQPFQSLVLCAIYGFRHRYDNTKRWTTDVIIHIPRKAGKTTLTAIIGLYELLCGDAGPEVFVLATNREQANICFDAAKGTLEQIDPKIRAKYQIYRHELKKVGDSQSTFRSLSRDTKKTGDGKNPSCVIVDEAAAIDERNAIEVLHSGMVARSSPLRIYITTSSFSRETKFHEDLQYLYAILDEQIEDNSKIFGLSYGLDEGDDWRDPATWQKANPMHGITVSADAIEQRALEASAKPASLNEFLCKTLNVWTSANAAWINTDYWFQSKRPKPDKEPEAVFIGFDLAETRDVNAVCKLSRYADDEYYAEFKMFLPKASLEHIPTHYLPHFHAAQQRGSLILTSGNTVDHGFISEYIKKLCEDTQNVISVGYDTFNASAVASYLEQEGLPIFKVGQGKAMLNEPSKRVEALILNKQIGHEGDPFVQWCLGNCEVKIDINGNIKVQKNEADYNAKIDPIVAMIIAMHRSLDNPFSSSIGIHL